MWGVKDNWKGVLCYGLHVVIIRDGVGLCSDVAVLEAVFQWKTFFHAPVSKPINSLVHQNGI